MSFEREFPPPLVRGEAQFTTTHWSVVLSASHDSSSSAHEALEQLCRTYWYPLYAYVRRCGHTPHDAQDLTQAFFTLLLQKHFLAEVRQERGRLRSFLLAALKHFLANECKRAHRLKRGGGKLFVPLQLSDGETRYGVEPADELTPEKIFERRWALTVLEQVLARLREEQVRDGKGALFEALKVFLTGDENAPSHAQISRRLETSPDAVKMAVSRLRRRYRELLRAEVAQTVANSADVDAEPRQMLAALG